MIYALTEERIIEERAINDELDPRATDLNSQIALVKEIESFSLD